MVSELLLRISNKISPRIARGAQVKKILLMAERAGRARTCLDSLLTYGLDNQLSIRWYNG